MAKFCLSLPLFTFDWNDECNERQRTRLYSLLAELDLEILSLKIIHLQLYKTRSTLTIPRKEYSYFSVQNMPWSFVSS